MPLKTPDPSPLVQVWDEENGVFDKLYAPRLEAFFRPSADGSPSLDGLMVFHTEKWHFRDNLVFAKSPGPRIEHNFNGLFERVWTLPDGTPVNTIEVILLMEQIFVELATESLAPPPPLPELLPVELPPTPEPEEPEEP